MSSPPDPAAPAPAPAPSATSAPGAATPPAAPSNPARYRPYRSAFLALFFLWALSFIGSVIFGGVSAVLRDRDLNPPADGPLPSQAACASDLSRVYLMVHNQLVKQAQDDRPGLGSGTPQGQAWGDLKALSNAIGVRCQLMKPKAPPGYERLQLGHQKLQGLLRQVTLSGQAYTSQLQANELELHKALIEAGAIQD